MKKILLLSLLYSAGVGIAQTIGVNDTLTATNVINYYAVDTSTTNLDAVNGAGVTWDYSTVLMADNSGAVKDTVVYIADSPNQSDFPNAQYHELFSEGPQTFFSNVGNDVIIHGFKFTSGANDYLIKYNNNDMIGLQLPMALNDNVNDNISGEAVVPSIGTVPLTGTTTVLADGTGTLMLPGSTYTDVIRVKTVESSSGTVLGQTIIFTRTSYAYYTQSTPTNFPVFIHGEINADLSLAGNINLKTIWSTEDSGFHLSNETVSKPLELKLYPNPADKNVFVTTTETNGTIEIFNTIGKIVYSDRITSPKQNINIEDLNAGIYFVQIKSQGSTLTKKLIVK